MCNLGGTEIPRLDFYKNCNKIMEMTVLLKPEEGWRTGVEIKLEEVAGFECSSTEPDCPGFEPVISGSRAEESFEGDACAEPDGVWPLSGPTGRWLSIDGP